MQQLGFVHGGSVKRFLILAVLLSGCDTQSPREENPGLPLPSCRVIAIGGCPHIWCSYGNHRSGLVSQDTTCRPVDARVRAYP